MRSTRSGARRAARFSQTTCWARANRSGGRPGAKGRARRPLRGSATCAASRPSSPPPLPPSRPRRLRRLQRARDARAAGPSPALQHPCLPTTTRRTPRRRRRTLQPRRPRSRRRLAGRRRPCPHRPSSTCPSRSPRRRPSLLPRHARRLLNPPRAPGRARRRARAREKEAAAVAAAEGRGARRGRRWPRCSRSARLPPTWRRARRATRTRTARLGTRLDSTGRRNGEDSHPHLCVPRTVPLPSDRPDALTHNAHAHPSVPQPHLDDTAPLEGKGNPPHPARRTTRRPLTTATTLLHSRHDPLFDDLARAETAGAVSLF